MTHHSMSGPQPFGTPVVEHCLEWEISQRGLKCEVQTFADDFGDSLACGSSSLNDLSRDLVL